MFFLCIRTLILNLNFSTILPQKRFPVIQLLKSKFKNIYPNNNGLNYSTIIQYSYLFDRFADVRNTLQGKLEERLPFFSFAFPEWFKQKHKVKYENLQENMERLTTPFDIHATLEDILSEFFFRNILKRISFI